MFRTQRDDRRYAQVSPLCGPSRGHGRGYAGGMPRLGGIPPCRPGGNRPRRPLAPVLGRGHCAVRHGCVESHHLLLRSNYESKGGGGAQAGAACYRLTCWPPPDETPGAADVARLPPAIIGAGGEYLAVRSGPGPCRRHVIFHWRLKELSAQIERARYRANCLPGLREQFRRDTAYLATGATKETGEVFSQ